MSKNGFFKIHFFGFFEQNCSKMCPKHLKWPCFMLTKQKKPFEKKFLKNSILSFYGQIPINVKKRFFRNSLFCFFWAKLVQNMSKKSKMAMFYAKKTKKIFWKKIFEKFRFVVLWPNTDKCRKTVFSKFTFLDFSNRTAPKCVQNISNGHVLC